MANQFPCPHCQTLLKLLQLPPMLLQRPTLLTPLLLLSTFLLHVTYHKSVSGVALNIHSIYHKSYYHN